MPNQQHGWLTAVLSTALRVSCFWTAGYIAAPGGSSAAQEKQPRQCKPLGAAWRAEHPLLFNCRQPLDRSWAPCRCSPASPPASARKAAVAAGRRWKGRVIAARSVPSSTLRKEQGRQGHAVVVVVEKKSGAATVRFDTGRRLAWHSTRYGSRAE